MVNWKKKHRFAKFFYFDGLLNHFGNLLNRISKFPKIDNESRNITNGELPTFHYGLVIPPEIYQDARIDDILNEILEPFYANLLYYLDLFELHNLQFSVPYVKPLSLIHENYGEVFQHIIQMHEKRRWVPVDSSWVPYNPIILNMESKIRQYLYGQRFLIEHFRKISNTSIIDASYPFDLAYIQNLPELGIDTILLRNSNFLNLISTSQKLKPSFKLKTLSAEMIGFSVISDYLWEDYLQILDLSQNMSENLPIIKEFVSSDQYISNISSKKRNRYFGPSLARLVKHQYWQENKKLSNISIQKFNTSKIDDFKLDSIYKLSYISKKIPLGLISDIVLKSNNYIFENLIKQTEILSVISGLLGREHFQDELEQDWKIALALQEKRLQSSFVCIENIRDAITSYMQLFRHLHSSLENACMNTAHAIRETTKQGYFTIFNTLGWQRAGYVSISQSHYNQAVDLNQTTLNTQRIKFSTKLENLDINMGLYEIQENFLNLYSPTPENFAKKQIYKDIKTENQELFEKDYFNSSASRLEEHIITKDKLQNQFTSLLKPKSDNLLVEIPFKSSPGPFGMCNIVLLETSLRPHKSMKEVTETNNEFKFQNQYYQVIIDKNTGYITQIYQKETAKILEGKGISYNLNEISSNLPFLRKRLRKIRSKVDYNEKLKMVKFETLEKGPLRHSIQFIYNIEGENSQIATRYSFYRKSPIIYGETILLWLTSSLELSLSIELNKQLFETGEILSGNGSNQPINLDLSTLRNLEQDEEIYVGDRISYIPFKNYFAIKGNDSTEYLQNFVLITPNRNCIGYKFNSLNMSLIHPIKYQDIDLKIGTYDIDFESRNQWSDQGIMRIPWQIMINNSKLNKEKLAKIVQDINTPLISIPSHAIHKKVNFFTIDNDSVCISHIKEADAYLKEAPDWFYQPTMADIPIVVRLVERTGNSVEANLRIAKELNISKAFEIDLLERISDGINQEIQKTITNNEIKLKFKPHELKNLYLIGKLKLEDD